MASLRKRHECVDGRIGYEPTPEQIRQMCFEIQSGWDACEERKRAGRPKQEMTVPRVSCRCDEALDGGGGFMGDD